MTHLKSSWHRCALVASIAAGFTSSAFAQDFETKVIADGLEEPAGIAVSNQGIIYFTELPTPGISGDEGGTNRVMKFNARTGDMELVSMGEPEPLNVAVRRDGTIYWTCRSAGVILAKSPTGDIGPIMDGLEQPSGIDARFRYVSFTEIPTPGVSGDEGGANQISTYDGVTTFPVSLGEPEPADVTTTPDGMGYWTCRTAGVILRRTLDGEIVLVKDGLSDPLGLASDDLGRLYWTEVPTPGVSGDDGGRNRVVRYNPATEQLDVINEGDPYPQDIAVTDDGAFIFWTCRSAGVIVAARER